MKESTTDRTLTELDRLRLMGLTQCSRHGGMPAMQPTSRAPTPISPAPLREPAVVSRGADGPPGLSHPRGYPGHRRIWPA